jgi:hypothetical protein
MVGVVLHLAVAKVAKVSATVHGRCRCNTSLFRMLMLQR